MNGNGIRALCLLTAIAAISPVQAASDSERLGGEIAMGLNCAELLSIREQTIASSAAKQRARLAIYQYNLTDSYQTVYKQDGKAKARAYLRSLGIETQVTVCKVFAKQGLKPFADQLGL